MGNSIRKQTEFPLQSAPALDKRVIVDIPLTAIMDTIFLKLEGSVTIGTAAASSLVTDGITNLITSIDLIGDGRDTLISIPFHTLVKGNIFRNKNNSLSTVGQPALTVGTNAFSVYAALDLAQFGTERPKDSSLDETQYKTLQLAVRFASAWTAVFVNPGTATFATATLDLVVEVDETIEFADDKGHVTKPIFKPQYSSRDQTVAAATNKERFRLTPDQSLRGLIIRATTAANALSDAVLSRVRVYVGNDLRVDLAAATLAKMNELRCDGVRNTGYYALDFADRKGASDYLNDCLDLRQAAIGGKDAYVELDFSVAGTANVVQWGIVAA
jgi:hypothetical protein